MKKTKAQLETELERNLVALERACKALELSRKLLQDEKDRCADLEVQMADQKFSLEDTISVYQGKVAGLRSVVENWKETVELRDEALEIFYRQRDSLSMGVENQLAKACFFEDKYEKLERKTSGRKSCADQIMDAREGRP